MTYGTYDLFHYGHIALLKRARAMGSRLFVGVSTDEFNALKGKSAFMSYAERQELLLSCRYVDHVFPEMNWEQKIHDVKKYDASMVVMGDDWKGKFDELKQHCQVSYLARTPLISSTMLRDNLTKIKAA